MHVVTLLLENTLGLSHNKQNTPECTEAGSTTWDSGAAPAVVALKLLREWGLNVGWGLRGAGGAAASAWECGW